MKGKVTFNKSGSGSKSGRVTIPVALLEVMGISEDNREVEITLKDNKIIIERVASMNNLVDKTWGELSDTQREELLHKAISNEKEGDSIIDFEESDISIAGRVSEDGIEIDDSAIFYNPIN